MSLWTPSSANLRIKCLPSAWPPKPREALSFAPALASRPGRMTPSAAGGMEGDPDESAHLEENARRFDPAPGAEFERLGGDSRKADRQARRPGAATASGGPGSATEL